MYTDQIVVWRVIENKQVIYVAKSKGYTQKAFQTGDIEIRYDCAKRCHILCIDCANGILYGLCSVLSVTIFFLYAIFFDSSLNQGK